LKRIAVCCATAACLAVSSPLPARSGAETWIEAHQSSPADYDFVIPASLNLPPEARQRLRDRPPVVGTLRMRVIVAIGGKAVRVRFSNEEGLAPLRIGAATIGLAGNGFDARPETIRPLTFGGAKAATIPPGAPMLSDAIALPVDALTELVVSVQLPDGLKLKPFGNAVMAMANGDQTSAGTLVASDTIIGRPPVSGVSILTEKPTQVVIALGDSLTDANRPVLMQDGGWLAKLRRRFVTERPSHSVSFLAAAIGGNRVLSTSWGKSALVRLDRDVLRIAQVSHVILLEGINDIGNGGCSALLGCNPALDPADLINGYRQVIARAHAAGVKVVMGTLPPFAGANSFTAEREAQRAAINRWIRSSGEPDAIVDFDAALRDPADPSRLAAAFDSGDHLHPSEEGYAAMARAVDLSMFETSGLRRKRAGQ
jgi:lysophospholipase L1-like esterase